MSPDAEESNKNHPKETKQDSNSEGGKVKGELKVVVHPLWRTLIQLSITGVLLIIFAIVVGIGLSKAETWAQAKELLQIVIPVLTAFLGTALGFYFGKRIPGE